MAETINSTARDPAPTMAASLTRATSDLSFIAGVLRQNSTRDREAREATATRGVLPDFAKGLFTGVIFLSTFGGSITFQTIIQDLGTGEDENPGHRFSRRRARTFLAISWLLFVIDLGVSAILIAMLYLYRGKFGNDWADHIVVRVMSFIFLPGVLIGALLFSSLAVTAYSEPTGWTAVGFCGIFGLAVIAWWFTEVMYVQNVPTDILS
jgi:hypothetical protein